MLQANLANDEEDRQVDAEGERARAENVAEILRVVVICEPACAQSGRMRLNNAESCESQTCASDHGLAQQRDYEHDRCRRRSLQQYSNNGSNAERCVMANLIVEQLVGIQSEILLLALDPNLVEARRNDACPASALLELRRLQLLRQAHRKSPKMCR